MARKNNRRKDYQRADYPEQKDERRKLILRSAAEELSLVGFSADFTVNALAQRAGLAKGTVYLYFKSKNAILFELLGEATQDFLIDIVVKFSKLPEPVNAKQAALTIRDALKVSASERRLPQLLKSRSDKDSGTSDQYKYQKRIKPFMERADAIIVSRLHGLRLGEGNKILRFGWALLLGLSDIADHQPKPAVTPFDVEQDLREALTRLIEGYLGRP